MKNGEAIAMRGLCFEDNIINEYRANGEKENEVKMLESSQMRKRRL